METTGKRIGIGEDDFRCFRDEGYYFVDKSPLIRAVIRGTKAVLLPRPRRFGKTLNLSMLRYFFDRREAERNARLFDGLTVQQDPAIMAHQGRYPVISLSLKNLKSASWETTLGMFVKRMADLYKEHGEVAAGLAEDDRLQFERLAGRTGSRADLALSLSTLIDHLYAFYGKPVVLLIDEYDTPVIEAWNSGYYGQMIEFMRSWMGAALKHEKSEALFRAVVTGILRVSKESLFSDLNNLRVHSILSPGAFEDKFGFTQEELDRLLSDFSLPELGGPMRDWYNGYRFGSTVIYNPWSVLMALDAQPEPLGPYWLNTASTTLIAKELAAGGLPLKADLEKLLAGGELRYPLVENTVFADLEKSTRAIWSFLTFAGYLRAEDPVRNPIDETEILYRLSIPNLEVGIAYRQFVEGVFSDLVPESLSRFITWFLAGGEPEELEALLQELVAGLLSVHDVARQPEAVFHAFVLGLLAGLRQVYEIRSNAESGYGRADILLRPLSPRHPWAYVIEFKAVRAKEGAVKTAQAAAARALTQVDASGYVMALASAGIPGERIRRLAVVLAGKRVAVRAQARPQAS